VIGSSRAASGSPDEHPRPLRHPGTHEQLIAALLPDVTAPQPTPLPAPMPSLPAPNPPRLPDPETLLLGTARLDRSGRVHERTLFRALGWEPGHELTIDTVEDVIVISSVSGGGHRIDDRRALALPAAARRMCGIAIGPPVVLIAAVPEQTVLIYPAITVTGVLAAQYATLIGTHDAR
jgi:hypothetical protein